MAREEQKQGKDSRPLEPGPDDFILDDFDPTEVDQSVQFEIVEQPDPRKGHKAKLKHQMRKMNRQRALEESMVEIEPGTSIHLISSGRWDFWRMVPMIHRKYGRINSLYFTTWMVNRDNLSELFEMHDQGMIDKFTVLIGTYLKRRNTDVYGFLSTGCLRRKQDFVVFRNHTKVLLLEMENGWKIAIEASANMAANHNLEQFVITEDEGVWKFHKEWMDEMVNKRKQNLII